MQLGPFLLLTIAATSIASVEAKSIAHDTVAPFPQPEPATGAEKTAIAFKPSLFIKRGCHPYTAVNAAGDTSEGLEGTGDLEGNCKGSKLGSQVYSRSTSYSGKWAIMYAWYFPKDVTPGAFFINSGVRHRWGNAVVWLDNPALDEPVLVAISTDSGISESPVEVSHVNGTNTKMAIEMNVGAERHQISPTSEDGESQDLIQWEQMTDEARKALETADFGEDTNVPFIDAVCEAYIQAASTIDVYVRENHAFHAEPHLLWE